jgi:hemerythrin-like domain-containing protein
MSRTENFRRQHREIHEVVREIEALLDPDKLRVDVEHCRLLLSELVGKLSVHLAMEDNALYPRLTNHKDKQVSELAKQYMNEMGGIKKVFTEYAQRWRSPAGIEGSTQQFIDETRGIFKALAERIAKEDNHLYPLVDQYG